MTSRDLTVAVGTLAPPGVTTYGIPDAPPPGVTAHGTLALGSCVAFRWPSETFIGIVVRGCNATELRHLHRLEDASSGTALNRDPTAPAFRVHFEDGEVLNLSLPSSMRHAGPTDAMLTFGQWCTLASIPNGGRFNLLRRLRQRSREEARPKGKKRALRDLEDFARPGPAASAPSAVNEGGDEGDEEGGRRHRRCRRNTTGWYDASDSKKEAEEAEEAEEEEDNDDAAEAAAQVVKLATKEPPLVSPTPSAPSEPAGGGGGGGSGSGPASAILRRCEREPVARKPSAVMLRFSMSEELGFELSQAGIVTSSEGQAVQLGVREGMLVFFAAGSQVKNRDEIREALRDWRADKHKPIPIGFKQPQAAAVVTSDPIVTLDPLTHPLDDYPLLPSPSPPLPQLLPPSPPLRARPPPPESPPLSPTRPVTAPLCDGVNGGGGGEGRSGAGVEGSSHRPGMIKRAAPRKGRHELARLTRTNEVRPRKTST